MRNFACWRADDAYAIINPDVDALPDYVFRAVHTDAPVQIREKPSGPAALTEPQTLLKRFLAPRDHVLVPVIGQSGTGKSHLVRWMRLHLPSTAAREVIFVPKAQTNLRDIVRSLADRLPDDERAQFISELRGAGDVLHTPAAQRTAILNELHTALQNDPGDPHAGHGRDLEAYLLDGLRAIFNDHHLRGQHFLRDGAVAADLAAHVFERPDQYRPAEQRRVFTTADLPLAIGGMAQAGAAAREFLSELLGDELWQVAAAAIVNRHLDRAIARCLNITGDRLMEVMASIRRRLRADGKQLVLLIEDFARLQGLDRALLQSLIEQREDLCILRTAFACTTGFYGDIGDTVLTRLTFMVDMDLPLVSEGQGGVSLPRLAARYMNALRHGEHALREDAGANAHLSGENGFAISSRCDPCPHQPGCHAAFGAVDGFGLYPFTAQALQLMAERADAGRHDKLTTRFFQQDVLRPIALATSAIEEGRFPERELLEKLGGIQGFPPAERHKLEVADPTGWERRLALIQLWDGGAQAKNLPRDIQDAFGLSPAPLAEAAAGPSQAAQPSALRPSPQPQGRASDARVTELANWDNGRTRLSQATANALRPLLFKAIDDAIDWDAEGLAQADFRGPANAFQGGSLFFLNQANARANNLVSITIPHNWDDKEERHQTVMALQGLLEAEASGAWDFPDCATKMACLQERLSCWSAEVVRQLRELDAAGAEWNPAQAAFAVRACLAVLTGADASTNTNLGIVRAALAENLGPLGAADSFISPRLQSLVAEMRLRDGDRRATILIRRSAMKGSSKGSFLDAPALLADAAGIRKSGFIPDPPPAGLAAKPRELQQLARDAARLAADLRPALQDEADRRRRWLSDMDAVFAGASKAEIAGSAQNLANDLGQLGKSGVNNLLAALHAFKPVRYDAALTSARDLPEPGAERPVHLAIAGMAAAMRASADLARAWEAALTPAELEIRAQLQQAGIDSDAERSVAADVDAALAEISGMLEEGSHADAA